MRTTEVLEPLWFVIQTVTVDRWMRTGRRVCTATGLRWDITVLRRWWEYLERIEGIKPVLKWNPEVEMLMPTLRRWLPPDITRPGRLWLE
jgi:hypothetical protein